MYRRRILARLGTAAGLALAGCTSTDPTGAGPTDEGGAGGTTVGSTTDGSGTTPSTSGGTTSPATTDPPLTDPPGPRTDPEGCLAGSPCSPGASLDLGERSVRVASAHRQVGYRHLTFPDAQGVRAPPDREFVVLGVEPADDGPVEGLPPADAFELVAGERRFPAGLAGGVGHPGGSRRRPATAPTTPARDGPAG